MASSAYARYSGLGGSGGGTGTVTSVGLSDGSTVPIYAITGSPVTSSGTLTFTLASQSANLVFAGPASGSAAQPGFRSLVVADLPLTFGNLTDAGTDGITIGNGSGAVIGTGTTISQHVADTTHNGYLSSTDWNTFNGKQAAGNYITALTGDGTASGPGSAALTLATVNSNVGSFTNASITVNAKGLITAASSGTTGNLTEATSAVLTISGGTGAVLGSGASIQVKQASGSQSGYLSSTDWTTFNGKGSGSVTSVTFTGDGTVLSSTPSSAVTTSGTLTAALATQAKNTVLAGPSSGSNAAPTFRSLVAADMPAFTGDITTSAGSTATTAAATQANITTLSNSSGVAVHGTNTNNSASAGYVGEVVTTNPGSGVTPGTSGNYTTIASISLTAGDWDVDGVVALVNGSSTTATRLVGAVSLSNNAADATNLGGIAVNQAAFPTSSTQYLSLSRRRISISGTTTVYLVGELTYSVLSTATYGTDCYLYARRAR